MQKSKVFDMPFGRVYPLLVKKAERKGRTQAEVDEIITWLCGYSAEEIHRAAEDGTAYGDFFRQAGMNPDRVKITGKVCGIQVETIEDPLMRDIRYLDKLVDELAKGKKMEKILRKEQN
ncbi:MAG: DUF2200 domain-containing protein [Erysipelotrichaceae bacterium]